MVKGRGDADCYQARELIRQGYRRTHTHTHTHTQEKVFACSDSCKSSTCLNIPVRSKKGVGTGMQGEGGKACLKSDGKGSWKDKEWA